jgi:hypothetical protein
MGAMVNGLFQNLWIELALGGAAGFAGALLFTYWQNRGWKHGKSDDEELRAAYERRQFLLYCADAKVIADLAVQRHMTDANFLQHLRINPCFIALSPFFSEEFRVRLTQEPSNEAIKSFLPAAFQQEVTRLETTADPLNPPPFGPFNLKDSPAPGGRTIMATQNPTAVNIPTKLHQHEAEKF